MPLSAPRQLARDIFRELIETDTSPVHGTVAAAERVAVRLHAAGFPAEDVRVLGPHRSKVNLVARLRGTGVRRPLLLLAHLDVVEALREDWSVDPFTLLEREGYFYGRGTTDDKAMAAIWITNLIRLRQEEWTPERDIVLALTADEEGGDHNGAEWLLANHRPLVAAEFGLNEGGYGRTQEGRRTSNQVQASEKLPLFLELEAEGRGGHSALPSSDNAVHILARGLARLAEHRFPARLNPATRGFFAHVAETAPPETAADARAILRVPPDPDALERISADPYHGALLRTTCAATQLEAGHAPNALPHIARAVVDCRMLPDEDPAEVQRVIEGVLADGRITVRPLTEAKAAPPSPLLPEVMGAVERTTAELWAGVPVVPVMSIGATDSTRFRRAGIPMYGVSGLFLDIADARAHGPDERIPVRAFFEGQEFLWRLVCALAGHSNASSAAGSEA